MKRYGRFILATLFLALLATTSVWADDDPPGRVARLQYMSGSVSIQPQGTEDWVEGALNRPLTISDNIWTDKNARAELNVGTGTLRMNDETSVTFTNLNDRTVQVELHQGTLSLHIRKLYGGEIYEIDTPNYAFTIQKSGDYRFEVAPEGDISLIKVYKGEGYATGDGPAVKVRSEEEARFSNGTSLEHTFTSLRDGDGFDDWGKVRDKRLDRGASAQYVSRDVIGYEDLDDNGVWNETPDYGPVWVPSRVSADWAPYRYGHWVWVSPWGWTWVDDASWGFAPFHYGRWVSYRNGWGWAPGPVYARPVYAPALVSWFGGAGWGVSLGFGGGPGYGWCPLGYGEPFVPWYRGSRNYFRNVNVSNTRITNITNVTNNYYNNPRGGGNRNFANMRGATAVSEQTILGSRSVSGAIVRVPQGEFARAPRGNVNNLAPTRTSRLGENAGRPSTQPPARSFARPVVSKMQAPVRNNEGGFNRGNRPESGAIRVQPGQGARMPSAGEGVRNPSQGTNASGSNGSPMRNNVPRPGKDNNPRSGAITNNGGQGMQSPNRPTTERNVPRPPDRSNSGDRNNMPQRTQGPENSNSPRSGAIVNRGAEQNGMRNDPRSSGQPTVPRPPSSGDRSNSNTPARMQGPENSNSPRSGGIVNRAPDQGGSRNTPRPTAEPSAPRGPSNNGGGNNGGGNNGGGNNGGGNNGGVQRSAPPQRSSSDNGRRMDNPRYVPRPTGRVQPASSRSVDYRSPQSSNSFAASSRGTSQNSYQTSPRAYSAPSRSYGMSSQSGQGRSYSAPASRSYSSPSRNGGSSVSSNSGRYRAAPSDRSAPSGRGSSGGRSFGGGGGGGRPGRRG